MPRPETRLDQEYDPAERHDLDRLDRALIGQEPGWDWVCACGQVAPWRCKTQVGAFRSHWKHQEESR